VSLNAFFVRRFNAYGPKKQNEVIEPFGSIKKIHIAIKQALLPKL
jgi:hypothetical protein